MKKEILKKFVDILQHKLSEKRSRLRHRTDFHDNTRYDEFKKSKLLSNWPKWLFVTQSVLFGNQAIEIRSFDS